MKRFLFLLPLLLLATGCGSQQAEKKSVESSEQSIAAETNEPTSSSESAAATELTETPTLLDLSKWDYYEEGNYIILTRYKGQGNMPKIPSTYKGKKVQNYAQQNQ